MGACITLLICAKCIQTHNGILHFYYVLPRSTIVCCVRNLAFGLVKNPMKLNLQGNLGASSGLLGPLCTAEEVPKVFRLVDPSAVGAGERSSLFLLSKKDIDKLIILTAANATFSDVCYTFIRC